MDESQLQVFIDGSLRYFDTVTEAKAEVGTPFLIDGQSSEPMDYTGIIGISGRNKGMVYFTASRSMLVHLLANLGEPDCSPENIADLVGEVANTISGNARKDFGKDFMISVPVVVHGENERVRLPKGIKSYAIPVHWKGHRARLVISVQ